MVNEVKAVKCFGNFLTVYYFNFKFVLAKSVVCSIWLIFVSVGGF